MDKICTVIIPAYNAGETIEQCLAAFFPNGIRRYETEIIVVDDGSVDNTVSIVNRFSQNHKNIKLISQKNSGVSTARNNGLENATGKWVYFADADDIANVHILEKMIEISELTGCGVIIADYILKEQATGHCENKRSDLLHNRCLQRDYIVNVILRRLAVGEKTGLSNLWNKLYKRSVIQRNDIHFDENRTHGEDWKFNIDYFEVVETAYAIDDPIYTYIINGSQNYSKYSGKLEYSLINGHILSKQLINKYKYLDQNSDDYIDFMGKFLYQSLNYLKLNECTDKEKKAFLSAVEEKSLYSFFLKVKKDKLQLIGFSRKSYLAFFLLKFRLYKTAMKIIY